MAALAVTEELWEAHHARGDRLARESLILHYAPLVRHVAGRIAIALPPVLDLEDSIGAGMLGLIRAVEHYDPRRGVPFESYASACIRGSILDQLRSLDVISRSVRQKAREIERTMAALQAELGRFPTDEEMARALGMNLESYHRALLDTGPTTVSLDAEFGSDPEGEAPTLLSTLVDTDSPDPVSITERRALVEAVTEAVSRLSQREQLLLALYYKEDLTMKEISQVLGVSESRVCQLHTRGIFKLKAQLRLWHQQRE